MACQDVDSLHQPSELLPVAGDLGDDLLFQFGVGGGLLLTVVAKRATWPPLITDDVLLCYSRSGARFGHRDQAERY